jgi:lipid A 3-O-deacylase
MTAELFGSGAHRAPLQKRAPIAIRSTPHIVARQMRIYRVACVSILVAMFSAISTFGGAEGSSPNDLDAPNFESSVESAFLFSILGNPHRYQIGAEFLTARVRWGINESDSWLRGYNQFYVLAMAEPIFSGPENHYFGMSTGMRYNFVRPNWRLLPYISGGVGLGWIDSHANIPGAQGQDFTFNILTAVGVAYEISDRWKLNAGALYEHLSNGGQTSPNPSTNLLGPQIGVTYSF